MSAHFTRLPLRYVLPAGAMALSLCLSDASHGIVIETPTLHTGRFVRVQNNGAANRLLHIGEIEVFAGGTTPAAGLDNVNDLALSSKLASIESFVGTGGHGSELAVIDGLPQSGGATWTRGAVNAEIVVDLGGTHNVDQIRVWQRTDTCCNSRLSDFTVSVLADDGAGNPGAVAYSQSFPGEAPSSSFALARQTTRVILPGGAGVIGTDTLGDPRFIKVENNGSPRTLHLGELEAFLTGVTPSAGLDNTNDLALLVKGASFESESGIGGHGSVNAPLSGVRESGASTYSRDGAGFYMADLGDGFDVGTVRLWQRGDGCCDGRLSNVTVSLLGDAGTGGPGDLLESQVFAGQVPRSTPATLSFNPTAQFTVLASDTLVIEIDPLAGLADLLKIGAAGDGILNVTPGATLEFVFLNSMKGGQTYNILDFGSINGSFNIINGEGLDLSNLLIDGTISTAAIPEPATAALGLIALAGLMRRRRGVA